MKRNGIITDSEKALAARCMEKALGCGASGVRVSLSKTVSNGIAILDGKTDKITYSADRSIFLHIFADGRYGTFSTNRLEEDGLDRFVARAVGITRQLAPDCCRSLPSPGIKATGCQSGDELALADDSYFEVTQEKRLKLASAASSAGTAGKDGRWSLESAEDEYSDSYDDNYLIDSDGFEGRHMETSYAFCSEVTVKDGKGDRYSGYWWNASPFMDGFDISDTGPAAVARAAAQIGPRGMKGGRYNIVVDRSCSSRLVGPVLNALDALAVQQGNSFLAGSAGTRMFQEHFTLCDRARTPGRPGSRMFDTEGVATKDAPVIENGTVKQYFVNTYMAAKTGMAPTIESISRPCLEPFICNCNEKEIHLEDILNFCGDGVYITGFNGGNCNQATGNFSFGAEGILFRDGKMLHPVNEMLVTGDMLTLWNSLTAVGSDPRPCARWQIPTLAFKDVNLAK